MPECANCGSTADLHVHHIVPRGLGGTERPSNKVTLCVDCHAKVHGWGSGYAKAWKHGMELAKANGGRKPPKVRNWSNTFKRTPEVLEEIKRAILAGERTADLAVRLGMSAKTLSTARKQLGLPRQPPGRKPSGIKTKKRDTRRNRWSKMTSEQKERRRELRRQWRKKTPLKPHELALRREQRKRWGQRNPEKIRLSNAKYKQKQKGSSTAGQFQLFEITGQLQ